MQFCLHMRASTLLLSLLCALPGTAWAADSPAATVATHSTLESLTVPFIENRGEHPPNVRFYVETFAGTCFVARDGALIVPVLPEDRSSRRVRLVRLTLDGARPSPPRGLESSGARAHLSLGPDSSTWRSNVETFASVTRGDVYDGIELRFAARGRNVEQIFVVRPGADPSAIRVRVDGARVAKGPAGSLTLRTPDGELGLTRPRAHQTVDGERRPVEASYDLLDDGYAFSLGEYDPEQSLVIDPLLRATYSGGIGAETVSAVWVHPSSGDVYVAGGTRSTGFVDDGMATSHTNAYLVWLDPSLTEIRFVQYMGGLGDEAVDQVVMHPDGSPFAGQVVVAGTTTSTRWPAQGYGTYGEDPVDRDNLYVGLFKPNLQTEVLRWISGSVMDQLTDVALHPTTFEAYLAGSTNSSDFPGTFGGFQPTRAGPQGLSDGFVARLAPDLRELRSATYLGGATGGEVDLTLAVTPGRGVYVKGRSSSFDAWCGERSPGPSFQGSPGGGTGDLFVALLDEDLAGATALTFLGGGGNDDCSRTPLVVDPGAVYVTGTSGSDDWNAGIDWRPGAFIARFDPELGAVERLQIVPGVVTDVARHPTGELFLLGYGGGELPMTEGAVQPEPGGGLSEAWVARFEPDLTWLRSTHLGGDGRDQPIAMSVHPDSGDLYIIGYTDSTAFPRSTAGAFPNPGGFEDAFIARLAPDLSDAAGSPSTYYGGMAKDWPRAVVIDAATGDVIVAGETWSRDLPGVTGGAQPQPRGEPEAFVARFDASLLGDLVPDIEVSPMPLEFPDTRVGERIERGLTITNVGTADLSVDRIANLDATDFVVVVSGGESTCPPQPFVLGPGERCRLSVTFVPLSAGEHAGTVRIDSNDPDEATVEAPLVGAGLGGDGEPDDDGGGGGCDGSSSGAADALAGLVLALVALVFSRHGRGRCRRGTPAVIAVQTPPVLLGAGRWSPRSSARSERRSLPR